MRHRLASIVFWIMICGLFVSLLNSHAFRSLTICKNAPEGKPYRYTNRFSGVAALTDYCINDEYAYLLFEGTGVLKVYDLSGKYLHSFAFHTELGGRSELHADLNRVYLEDQSNNIYSFMHGGFEKYYSHESSNCPKRFNDYQKRVSPDGVQYKKRWASIIALTPEGTKKTIVSRPFFLVFVDYYASIYHILFFVVFFGVYMTSKRKR